MDTIAVITTNTFEEKKLKTQGKYPISSMLAVTLKLSRKNLLCVSWIVSPRLWHVPCPELRGERKLLGRKFCGGLSWSGGL